MGNYKTLKRRACNFLRYYFDVAGWSPSSSTMLHTVALAISRITAHNASLCCDIYCIHTRTQLTTLTNTQSWPDFRLLCMLQLGTLAFSQNRATTYLLTPLNLL